ncbi:DNA primase [Nonomuraea sp. PA05]|uniref:phage/plasmid primase, P4 family n=1 Tax=Nonomuraea sp. PA05 TaxID=2604466 RepID=UPI0011D869CC|nr:phage/plasmid primase, P4 family [Nonomuraea sp. PA05]TYB50251.1 DNA primase [Nonomuraea sp. PA05]
MNDLLQAALQLHDAGLCVLPAAADGSKRPAIPWKVFQVARPVRQQVEDWFNASPPPQGLGVVCGEVSGNLEMLEFEGRAVAEQVAEHATQLAHKSGLADLWQRITSGYMELTPGGGIHILYRVDGGTVAGNTKLARRPATPEELAANPDDKVKVLIETRGEGGWVVLAPSAGAVHPTGRAWQLLAGGPDTIPTITAAERDLLHQLAAVFDRMPATGEASAAPTSTLFSQPAPAWDDEDGVNPGTDYNARTSWDEILIPRGWTRLWTDSAGVTYWRRPGKNIGTSATTGLNDGDNLFIFSTSVAPLDAHRPYDKFGALAVLDYGGDHSAAASALSAAGYGVRAERTVPAPAPAPPPVHGNLAPVVQLHPDGPPPLTVVEERTYAQSDDGNALHLVDRFGEVIRYCPERGRWLAWTGARWEWQPVGGGLVREYGKRVARGLPDGEKKAVQHKRHALSSAGTTAMLAQAQTDTRVVVGFDDLDNQPWQLNTPAGIVDLRTGILGPADAAMLHTKVTACAPDPDADMSRWQAFLADTFGEDHGLVAYLQRLVGYSATGSVSKHVLPFAVGSGGNGKGVFLESIVGVLGDYATTAPSGFLMAKANIQHETEIARLAGMRMVVCSEVADDDRFDEVKVKQLTGGDTLTARFMRQDHFTFKPTHHLWLMGNNQPSVRAGGRAFWRRLRLIPFEHEVPPEAMIDDLQGILAGEHGPALLAWIVAGAALFHQDGLQEPDTVKAATDGYAADQDTVSRFVAECCRIGGGEHVQIKKSKLREAYERFCFDEGATPVSAKALTMQLRKHGVSDARDSTARSYANVCLFTPDQDHDRSSDPSPDPSQPRFSPPADDDKYGGPGW